MTACNNCGEEFSFDPDWDDPPEGHEHIEVVRNPADEPSFVVEQRDFYCSHDCYVAASE